MPAVPAEYPTCAACPAHPGRGQEYAVKEKRKEYNAHVKSCRKCSWLKRKAQREAKRQRDKVRDTGRPSRPPAAGAAAEASDGQADAAAAAGETDPHSRVRANTPDVHRANGEVPAPLPPLPDFGPGEELPPEVSETGVEQSDVFGRCEDMCPRSLLDTHPWSRVWEMTRAADGTQVVDEARAVKAWRRPDAGREYISSELRTPACLMRTSNYLITDCLAYTDLRRDPRWAKVQFRDVWAYLKNRLRAIQQDFIVQHGSRGVSELGVRCMEVRARFHIMSAHLMCGLDQHVGAYDSKANHQCITDTVGDQLWYLYKLFRARHRGAAAGCGALSCAAEFAAYRVLVKELVHCDDHKKWRQSTGFADAQPGHVGPLPKAPWDVVPYGGGTGPSDAALLETAQEMPEVLSTPEMKSAMRILAAYAACNWVRFFSLAREVPYLQACLMSMVFPFARVAYVTALVKKGGAAAGSARRGAELEHHQLRKTLLFDTPEPEYEIDGEGCRRPAKSAQLIEFLKRNGFTVNEDGDVECQGVGWPGGRPAPCEPDFEPGGEPGSRIRFPAMAIEELRRGRSHAAVCLGVGAGGAPRPRGPEVVEVEAEVRKAAGEQVGLMLVPAKGNMKGLELEGVLAGSPAERCGMEKYSEHRLTGVDGVAVHGHGDLPDARAAELVQLRLCPPGALAAGDFVYGQFDGEWWPATVLPPAVAGAVNVLWNSGWCTYGMPPGTVRSPLMMDWDEDYMDALEQDVRDFEAQRAKKNPLPPPPQSKPDVYQCQILERLQERVMKKRRAVKSSPPPPAPTARCALDGTVLARDCPPRVGIPAAAASDGATPGAGLGQAAQAWGAGVAPATEAPPPPPSTGSDVPPPPPPPTVTSLASPAPLPPVPAAAPPPPRHCSICKAEMPASHPDGACCAKCGGLDL